MHPLNTYLQKLNIKVTSALQTQFQAFQSRKLEKGEFLVRENQIADFIAFIVKGKIRHFYNIEGKEYTRWVSLENNFVTAFISFVHGTPSHENLECIEEVELLVLNREAFFQLKKNANEIQALWVTSLEQEMVGYEQRVMQLITTNAEQRYLNFMETYPHFIQEVPQKYLASMLGIEPRHLSRIRKKLATGGK
ncbi:MAG: Crp/Fnr family transcriptional regulator [Bacteroidota bacterium]